MPSKTEPEARRRQGRSLLWPALLGTGAGIREALSHPDGTVALIAFLIATLLWTFAFAMGWELWVLDSESGELTMEEVFGRVSWRVVLGRVLLTGTLVGIVMLGVHFSVRFLTSLVLSAGPSW
jgi:hypothetical protein